MQLEKKQKKHEKSIDFAQFYEIFYGYQISNK